MIPTENTSTVYINQRRYIVEISPDDSAMKVTDYESGNWAGHSDPYNLISDWIDWVYTNIDNLYWMV